MEVMPFESGTNNLTGLMAVPTGDLRVGPAPARESVAFSLIVPTRNESHNLDELIQLLTPAIVSQVGDSYEIIVVDDDSPDKTWQVAAEIGARDPHVKSMRRVDERGLATAVIRGWQASRGALLGVIDADLQHPPEVIARLIAAMQGADLAVASREVEGGGTSDWSVSRLFISRSLKAFGKMILPGVLGRVTDPMTGFFIIRRTALQDVAMSPCGYKILVELLVRARIGKIVEVGYVFRSRQRGESKASIQVFFDYVQHLLRLRASVREMQREAAPQELRSKAVTAGRR
jgi:dolichol-phosphate mannosyltransferase